MKVLNFFPIDVVNAVNQICGVGLKSVDLRLNLSNKGMDIVDSVADLIDGGINLWLNLFVNVRLDVGKPIVKSVTKLVD